MGGAFLGAGNLLFFFAGGFPVFGLYDSNPGDGGCPCSPRGFWLYNPLAIFLKPCGDDTCFKEGCVDR